MTAQDQVVEGDGERRFAELELLGSDYGVFPFKFKGPCVKKDIKDKVGLKRKCRKNF